MTANQRSVFPSLSIPIWSPALAAFLMLAVLGSVAQQSGTQSSATPPASATPSTTQGQATAAQTGTPGQPPRPDKGKVYRFASTAHAPAPAMAPDAAIVAALRNVSATHVRQNIEKLVSFVNRNTLGSNNPELVAQGKGVVAARNWIREEFESYSKACGGCLEVKEDTFTYQPPPPRPDGSPAPGTRVFQPTEMTNVYAVLRGTDPEDAKRIYLVSGHYDSFFVRDMRNVTEAAPGANDDASGTAVSMECARVLSQHKFRATLIFMAVPGEEQGLLGSHHFAEMARQEGWNIEGVLNNDIVGGNNTPGDSLRNPHLVRVFSEGVPYIATPQEVRNLRLYGYENDSGSREIARYILGVGRAYKTQLGAGAFSPVMEYRADRFGRGGDHSSFNEVGYAAVRFTEWREDYNHQHQWVRVENGIQYGDLPQFVDFNYVANVARINAATLGSLAAAPAPPANVHVPGGSSDNTTTLFWDKPAEDAGISFEVLWRETDAADWQHAFNVGSNTRVTFDISKDNVVFAVRSMDKQGHRSLPVVPVPQRRGPAPARPTD